MKTPIVLCWSGGKDSAMTLYELQQQNDFEVVSLLTTVTSDFDRISMHGVRRELLAQQAEATAIPLKEVFITAGAANVEYEQRMGEALAQFKRSGIEHVAFGDIFLEDLREYRIEKLAQLELEAVFPIWKRETSELATSFIKLGFRATTSCIDPRKLDRSFAGREIDTHFLADLPNGVDPCGENGEFHSFVHAGPIFKAEIPILQGEVVERDGFIFCDLIPQKCVPTQDVGLG